MKIFTLMLFSIFINYNIAQNENKMNSSIPTEGKVIQRGKIIYTEIIIQASSEKVWQALTDFESYPTWNPFIKSFKGNPNVGAKIKVKIQAPNQKEMVFQPTVLVNEPNQEFRWIGQFILPRLFDGEHTFKIIDHQNGTCTFIQYERFRGILVPFLKKMLEQDTQQGFQLMNEAMKKRCEIV